MGCDASANEEGIFEMDIHSYANPDDKTKQRYVVITGMEPNEKIAIEILEGDER